MSYELALLAGRSRDGVFPPRLNTVMPATDLQPYETPDAYGLDLSKDGVIAKGTIPSSVSRVEKTVTISGQQYSWYYKRLWGISNTILRVGAQNYDDVYYEQGPDIPFNEDDNPILALVPFWPDFLFIAKESGGYALQNCGDSRGSILFQRTDLIQEMEVASADRIVELNGNVYISNEKGLMVLDAGSLRTDEATRLVRDEVSTLGFPELSLKADYQKRYVIGGSTFVLDTETGSVYRYNGSSFRYTTPQYHNPDYSPFNVDRLIFMVDHYNSSSPVMKYQIKLNDMDWGRAIELKLSYQNHDKIRTVVECPLGEPDNSNCRTFQLRITSMPDGKAIRSIMMDGDNLSFDDGFGE